MIRISGVSSYPGLELSGSNCEENSTPKPRGMKIWFKLMGVLVIRDSIYQGYTVVIWFYSLMLGKPLNLFSKYTDSQLLECLVLVGTDNKLKLSWCRTRKSTRKFLKEILQLCN